MPPQSGHTFQSAFLCGERLDYHGNGKTLGLVSIRVPVRGTASGNSSTGDLVYQFQSAFLCGERLARYIYLFNNDKTRRIGEPVDVGGGNADATTQHAGKARQLQRDPASANRPAFGRALGVRAGGLRGRPSPASAACRHRPAAPSGKRQPLTRPTNRARSRTARAMPAQPAGRIMSPISRPTSRTACPNRFLRNAAWTRPAVR